MTALDTNPDWLALLRTIRSYPHDVRPRLIAADWLDENEREAGCHLCGGSGFYRHGDGRLDVHDGRLKCEGEGRVSNGFAARAEFIRLQIELAAGHHAGSGSGTRMVMRERSLLLNDSTRWVPEGWTVITSPKWRPGEAGTTLPAVKYHNGFVEEVHCPLGWWLGGECRDCHGGDRPLDDTGRNWRACPTCEGTGTTVAHGPEVVARHPVTKVAVTDREPWDFRDGEFGWHAEGGSALTTNTSLPPSVCRTLAIRMARRYQSREAAEAALSRALLDPLREAAGLPPLPPCPRR